MRAHGHAGPSRTRGREQAPRRPVSAPAMRPPAIAARERCACGGGCPRCQEEPTPPVVTYDPQPEAASGSAGPETGTVAAAAAGPARCRVQSFALRFEPWNSAWPNGSGDYELRLPVRFSLELASGVGRSDCLVGQQKKGQVEYGRYRRMGRVNTPMIDRIASRFPAWTDDAPRGQRTWWDGAAWHAGQGSWRFTWFGHANERASFQDEPGFASPSALASLATRGYGADGIGTHSFPIYWGGSGHQGHFRFRTFVEDAATGAAVRELTWGMLIDYATPTSGVHHFYT